MVGWCCVRPSFPELGAAITCEQSCSDRARGAPCGVLASIPRRQRCWPWQGSVAPPATFKDMGTL